MLESPSTVAIATLSARVLDGQDCLCPRAGVVAALKVTGAPDALMFTLHVHVPRTAASLTRWIEALVADDPLLVGYRLGRTSRLLRQAGYARHLARTFNREGRYDVIDLVRGTPTPLSVTALLHGVMAIDEEALIPAVPISTMVAADLALINAAASWVIYVGRQASGKAGWHARRSALAQLGAALGAPPAHGVLAAALTGSVH